MTSRPFACVAMITIAAVAPTEPARAQTPPDTVADKTLSMPDDGYRVTMGRYDRPVAPDKFYEIVGRDDLADRYRSRQQLKTGLLVGGAAVALSAIAFAYFTQEDCVMAADPDACHDDNTTRGVLSGVVAAAGVGVALIGMTLDSHPVSLEEARRLADDYNRGLTPFVSRDGKGGGLVFGGTF